MKLAPSIHHRRGSTIVVVLILCCITLIILGSALQWSSTNTTLSGRNNEYFRTVAAAEGATEKLISRITADYRQGGEPWVIANAGSYPGIVPTSSDNALLSQYQFSDGQGNVDKMYVYYTAPAVFTNLNGPYMNLRGYATPFRIISNAKQLNSPYRIVGAVRQDFQLATIPIFQFAIFYNIDLEICPGPDMIITGPVHGNQDIYVAPGANLSFSNELTSASDIFEYRKDGDTNNNGHTYYGSVHKGHQSTLNLPIGTNNTPAAVREVVEVPPAGESATSDIGKERFYNKADMVIRIYSNNTIRVSSGLVNGFGTVIQRKEWDTQSNLLTGFITTNVSFFNKRENKTVIPIQIDIAKLKLWNLVSTNALRSLITNTVAAGNITVIYVVDQRTLNSSTETGVRLVNGASLLPKGLTVASPNPVYIWGDYNATDLTAGSTNTSATLPAAVIGDSISILSQNWADANSHGALASRPAQDTTVNAAFLAGIVETTNSVYSGGVENFPRFLEDWSSDTITYNGSMVVMFPSKYATGIWLDPGDTYDIYKAPIRKWAFDQNFYKFDKLPPGTPMIRALVRNTWAMIRPNTTTVVGP